jgi:hypothetical protein
MAFGLLAPALGLLAPALAQAQPVAVVPPPETLGEEMPAFEPPPPRPRLSLAVGVGTSFDGAGFADGTHPVPAFFAEGGIGDGLGGFDLGVFASSAYGRFTGQGETPIDRLALDAYGVLRPAARLKRDDQRYRMRVLHTLAVELGLGLERDGTTLGSGTRFEIHTGARVELPLAPPGQASELRLRLGFRRAFGLYTPQVLAATATLVSVGDSSELYAALAVVF